MRVFLQYISFLFLIMVVTSSCKKEEVKHELTREEAVEVITSTSALVGSCLEEFTQCKTQTTLQQFERLWGAKDIGSKIELPFTLFCLLNDLQLANYGTYTWNSHVRRWFYSKSPRHQLLFVFPSLEKDFFHNAVLHVTHRDNSSHKEKSFPSQKAVLTLNSEEVFSFSSKVSAENKNESFLDLAFEQFHFSSKNILIQDGENHQLRNISQLYWNDESFFSSDFSFDMDSLARSELFHWNYCGTSFLTTMHPHYIKGEAVINQVKLEFDYNFREFDINSFGKDVEANANEFLKCRLSVLPEGKFLAKIRWYYNKHEQVLEPFFEFSDGEIQPFFNFFTFII